MVSPFILSRIEKRNRIPRFGINSGEIGAFLQIAVPASKGEIFKLSLSAVLLCNDVFDVERTTERILREMTILTPVPGTATYCRT